MISKRPVSEPRPEGAPPTSTARALVLPPRERLTRRIDDASAVICVIGLGAVGVPLVVEVARGGFTVLGVERRAERLAELRESPWAPDAYVRDAQELVSRGAIQCRATLSECGPIDVYIVCVCAPAKRDGDADLGQLEAALDEIAPRLHPGALVVIESTLPPDALSTRVAPRLAASGLELEQEVFLAYAPERIDPGSASPPFAAVDRLVAGVGPASLDIACALYRRFFERVVPVRSPRVAELAKLYENAFRSVGVALANELANVCDRAGVDVWEVLDAAHTKPFGILAFHPGPGAGGPCIPATPRFLESYGRSLGVPMPLLAAAARSHEAAPIAIVEKCMRVAGRDGIEASRMRVLLVGVSYKRDVPDMRGAPSLEVVRRLVDRGARVEYHDPFVPRLVAVGEGGELRLESTALSDGVLAEADVVVVLTDHSGIDYARVVARSHRVLDARNATKHVREHREKITLL